MLWLLHVIVRWAKLGISKGWRRGSDLHMGTVRPLPFPPEYKLNPGLVAAAAILIGTEAPSTFVASTSALPALTPTVAEPPEYPMFFLETKDGRGAETLAFLCSQIISHNVDDKCENDAV